MTQRHRHPPRSATAALFLGVLVGLACGKSTPERASAPAQTTAVPVVVKAVDELDAASRTPRPAGPHSPVIWLGLDGLDWDLLDRLAAEGKMPNWKRLTAKGYSASLNSFMPVLSPVVWTTIVTGVGPDVHRVLDFQEVDPATGQKGPVSGRSRAVPALWNIASASGRSVGVVGWWATHPAEEVSGFFVSDQASPILFKEISRTGLAYPSSLVPGVQQIVKRETMTGDEELSRFVDLPAEEIRKVRESGAGLDNPLIALSRIIGSTRVQQRIARDLYDKNLPDLLFLYIEGTDAIGHVFAPYVAPKMTCVSDEDFAHFHKTVDAYYAMIDRMLGQWMRRADEDGATLIVNSDHGFKWGAERPCERSSLNPSTAAFWHRIHGVFAAYGAHVRPSAERGTASVFDLAPTVAAVAGLPIDRQMSGKLLTAAFPGVQPAPRKDLFGTVPVRRLATEALSEKEASEYAKGLRALGYLSGGEPEKLAPPGGTAPGVTEGGWNNLGVYYRETTKNLPAAEAAFQKALALRPDYASPQFNLAVLFRERGEDRKAIDWLYRSLVAGHADPEGTIVRWAGEYREKGKKAAAAEVLEQGSQVYPDSEPIARDLSLARFQAKDCPGALQSVARFEATSTSADTLNALALFQTCLGRPKEAVALFRRSLGIKPDQPAVVQSINLIEKGPPGER